MRSRADRGRRTRPPSRSASWPTTRARSRRERCSSASRARASTATISPSRPSRRARRRSSSSGRSTSPVPQVLVAERPRRDAGRRRRVLRRPVPRARGRRGHRHERQDDDGVPPRGRSSTRPGGRPALLTNIERRIGGEPAADGPQHARVDRPAAAASARCSTPATGRVRWRRRRSRRRKGRLAGTRFAVLVFTNLTQDHLDFHGTMEEYFAAKRALFEQAERAVVNVGDEWGARLAAGAARSALTPSRRTTTLDGIDLRLRGGFNRANALGAIWAARELGIDEAAIRAGIEARRGRAGALRVGRRGTAVRGDRRLRAHTRLARERAAQPRASSGERPADRRLRRRRRPRPREAAADGTRVAARARRPRDRDDRQPALRGSGGDRRSRSRTAGSRSCSTGAPRSRRRSMTHGPATSS